MPPLSVDSIPRLEEGLDDGLECNRGLLVGDFGGGGAIRSFVFRVLLAPPPSVPSTSSPTIPSIAIKHQKKGSFTRNLLTFSN